MTIKLADLYFNVQNKYSAVENMCKDYICNPPSDAAVYDISVTDEEILAETPEYDLQDPQYLEVLAVYRKICEKLPFNEGYLFHAAVIEVNGIAIAFTARSGTGKTTHVRLWKKVFGDKVGIINGDKPIIRFADKKPFAFGTPWAGKECFNRNTSAPLEAIVLLERATENKITRLSPKEAANTFLSQIYLPKNDNRLFLQTLALADATLKCTPVYRLGCNMDDSAAKIAYEGIFAEDLPQ